VNDQSLSTADIPRGQRGSLLSGVVVLDLTRFLAGPFASMILADQGATVLKVEPLTGDTTRYQAPYFFDGDSAYFLSINRNKKSLAIDIRSPQGREILDRLITKSDIILDNLRAPQRERLRLTYEHLEQVNPQIVSCSLTGFGSEGPYADRPAYDIIVEALGGVMSLTGPEGGPSVKAGVPIGDITAGLYATIGVLSGLEYRKRHGKGTHIDISMLDSQVSLLSYLAQYFFVSGVVPKHQGRAHVSIPTYNTFVTKDGREIVIAANTQQMWISLCGVLGRPELVDDPRFTANKDRLAHRDELVEILQAEFARWDCNDIYAALVDHEVPAAPINDTEAALSDPQVRLRDMVVSVEHRRGREFLTIGTPIKSDTPSGGEFASPPELGGDAAEVMSELGYTDQEQAAFAAAGVIKMGRNAGLLSHNPPLNEATG
jgi:CoA:oxalate CoA-transferase